LKKWKHLDPFERPSFDVMADTLLHGLIYAEWESLKFAKPPAPTEDDDEMDGIESGDDDEEVGIDVRNLSAPSSGSGSSIEKPTGGRKGRKKVNLHGHGGIEVSRKHDLDDIARAGGGGKVMYMFEKVSKSKM
jgi:DNA repair and recombination protein RAD54B